MSSRSRDPTATALHRQLVVRGSGACAATPGYCGRGHWGGWTGPAPRVIAAMSYALDDTEGEPPGHAVRTCKIGMRLGQVIGLDGATRSRLFYALLLKDAGCSAKMGALFGADDQVAKRS